MTLMFGQILRQGSSLFHEQSLFMQELILQRLLKKRNTWKMEIGKSEKRRTRKKHGRVLWKKIWLERYPRAVIQNRAHAEKLIIIYLKIYVIALLNFKLPMSSEISTGRESVRGWIFHLSSARHERKLSWHGQC